MKHVTFRKDVYASQAKNCLIYVQIGFFAWYIGNASRDQPMLRIELFRPLRRSRLPIHVEVRV